MTLARPSARALLPCVVALILGATSACGDEPSVTAEPTVTWVEPAAYSYTFTSSEGERSLIGTFRVTVRGGRVVEAAGVDDSARRAVTSSPEDVPTLAGLLQQWRQAREDGAEVATADFASDGHPERIELDWDGNAVDDEALYVISAYEPDAS